MGSHPASLPDIASLNQRFLTRFQQRGGVDGADFRPHWDGFLVNCFVTVLPQPTERATLDMIYRELGAMIRFTAEHVALFAGGDRVQFIVGWDESVRTTGRQILKRGMDACDTPRCDCSPSALEADSPLYPGWRRAIRFADETMSRQ
jgi:hypothetical protein